MGGRRGRRAAQQEGLRDVARQIRREERGVGDVEHIDAVVYGARVARVGHAERRPRRGRRPASRQCRAVLEDDGGDLRGLA